MSDDLRSGAPAGVTAVLSDIHANARALDAALDFIDREGIQRIINLGDVVGYGPNPRECFERVTSDPRFRVNLLGNHDRSLVFLLQTPEMDMRMVGMNRIAAESIAWTRKEVYGDHPWNENDPAEHGKQLTDKWVGRVDLDRIALRDPLEQKGIFRRTSTPEELAAIKKEVIASFFHAGADALDGYRKDIERLHLGRRFFEYFSAAEADFTEGDAIFAHDNIVSPGDDKYTMDKSQQKQFNRDTNIVNLDQTCEAAAERQARFVFVGHLHHAKIYRIPKRHKAKVDKVLNVGSVGFSRGDPKNRVTFALFAPEEKKPVQLIRLEYAWENVKAEIEREGIPLPRTFQAE